LSRWDVSRVTDMSCMFLGATQFTGHAGLSQWDLGNIRTDRGDMFSVCPRHKTHDSLPSDLP
jgi:hypothetical protein